MHCIGFEPKKKSILQDSVLLPRGNSPSRHHPYSTMQCELNKHDDDISDAWTIQLRISIVRYFSNG